MFLDMVLTEVKRRTLCNSPIGFRHHPFPFARFPWSEWAVRRPFHFEGLVRVFPQNGTGKCFDEEVPGVWSQVEAVPVNVAVSSQSRTKAGAPVTG